VRSGHAVDRRNRIASWTRSSVTQHYSYDLLGNLTGYATPTAATPNQTFGGTRPHAITQSSASGSTVSYAHDADGNLASATGGAANRYYSFDWANRMVAVGTAPGTSGVLAVGYDVDGMRTQDLRAVGRRAYVDDHFTMTFANPAVPGQ
jgi:uncharacterized protein RhaS with RHS repeats